MPIRKVIRTVSTIPMTVGVEEILSVPAWKQLDCRHWSGQSCSCHCKDMSRAGRDYLQTGLYTEVFFRQHHVHFVAIANSVDSDDQNSNEFAPFLNIMNEWYLRDLSRKQKTAIRVKGESGKPTTNCAIYGYKKMPGDKYQLVYRRGSRCGCPPIFRLTIEETVLMTSPVSFYDDKVETPAVYAAKQGCGVWKSKKRNFPTLITGVVISLGRFSPSPNIWGHTVNFRSHKQSYKDKNPVMNPQEDWLIFENTHEAIVDKETWELAQKLRKTPRRHDTLGEANPLTGLLFCADCGRKWPITVPKAVRRAIPIPLIFMIAPPTHWHIKSALMLAAVTIFGQKRSESLILETIRTASTFAIANQDEFMKRCVLLLRSDRRKSQRIPNASWTKTVGVLPSLIPLSKSSTNPLPLGALPMNALIPCLQNTKRSRKLLSHLYRMQNRICPPF